MKTSGKKINYSSLVVCNKRRSIMKDETPNTCFVVKSPKHKKKLETLFTLNWVPTNKPQQKANVL